MDINALMLQSLQLLGLGMGAVFIILSLLIALITLVSRLVPEEAPPTPVVARSGVDTDHVAALTAALHQYRTKR